MYEVVTYIEKNEKHEGMLFFYIILLESKKLTPEQQMALDMKELEKNYKIAMERNDQLTKSLIKATELEENPWNDVDNDGEAVENLRETLRDDALRS